MAVIVFLVALFLLGWFGCMVRVNHVVQRRLTALRKLMAHPEEGSIVSWTIDADWVIDFSDELFDAVMTRPLVRVMDHVLDRVSD